MAIQASYPLTYREFHYLFTLPPIVTLLWRLRRRIQAAAPGAGGAGAGPRVAAVVSLLVKLAALRNRLLLRSSS
ncbi:hypothetical protein T484DRAFT_1858186 [Baffinella frigidus]|nr:hypothetical protein T484DRAFT_1858186 [Cryptophyta sp. CCMP2293]